MRDRRLDVDVKYYADGENGIKMEQDLIVLAKEWGLNVYIDSQSDKKVEKGSKKRSNAYIRLVSLFVERSRKIYC